MAFTQERVMGADSFSLFDAICIVRETPHAGPHDEREFLRRRGSYEVLLTEKFLEVLS